MRNFTHHSIFNKNKKRDAGRDIDRRIPLRLPLAPDHDNVENHKKKKKKSSNDYVININDEFVVDFDIDADKGNIIGDDSWSMEIKYEL
tara:strand:- start:1662 stop:1928 length:267 start_codon:yes stop_codon:yes gene_type:complete